MVSSRRRAAVVVVVCFALSSHAVVVARDRRAADEENLPMSSSLSPLWRAMGVKDFHTTKEATQLASRQAQDDGEPAYAAVLGCWWCRGWRLPNQAFARRAWDEKCAAAFSSRKRALFFPSWKNRRSESTVSDLAAAYAVASSDELKNLHERGGPRAVRKRFGSVEALGAEVASGLSETLSAPLDADVEAQFETFYDEYFARAGFSPFKESWLLGSVANVTKKYYLKKLKAEVVIIRKQAACKAYGAYVESETSRRLNPLEPFTAPNVLLALWVFVIVNVKTFFLSTPALCAYVIAIVCEVGRYFYDWQNYLDTLLDRALNLHAILALQMVHVLASVLAEHCSALFPFRDAESLGVHAAIVFLVALTAFRRARDSARSFLAAARRPLALGGVGDDDDDDRVDSVPPQAEGQEEEEGGNRRQGTVSTTTTTSPQEETEEARPTTYSLLLERMRRRRRRAREVFLTSTASFRLVFARVARHVRRYAASFVATALGATRAILVELLGMTVVFAGLMLVAVAAASVLSAFPALFAVRRKYAWLSALADFLAAAAFVLVHRRHVREWLAALKALSDSVRKRLARRRAKPKIPAPGDACPICLAEFYVVGEDLPKAAADDDAEKKTKCTPVDSSSASSGGDHLLGDEEIVYCKWGCGQAVHASCMQRWRQGYRNECVVCSAWWG